MPSIKSPILTLLGPAMVHHRLYLTAPSLSCRVHLLNYGASLSGHLHRLPALPFLSAGAFAPSIIELVEIPPGITLVLARYCLWSLEQRLR